MMHGQPNIETVTCHAILKVQSALHSI